MPRVVKYVAFSVILLFFTSVFAVPQTIPSIPGLPGALTWQNSPHSWQLDSKNVLTISAEAKTDWFVDPFDDTVAKNAPILLFTPDADYVLSTRVALKFVTKWDAGALMRRCTSLYEGDLWKSELEDVLLPMLGRRIVQLGLKFIW